MDTQKPEQSAGGIYIHFPYCRHRCHYCDFALVTPERIPQEDYTRAVLHELELRAGSLPGAAQTLYFGGGTPSLWEPAHVASVIERARAQHGLVDDAEITLELNPEDADQERLSAYVEVGVNRLSLGVQSLLDERLQHLDRGHDARRAAEAVAVARDSGVSAVSLDLIFATPGQGIASWQEELAGALALGVDHLSIYGLTVEPRTRLERLIDDGAYPPVDDDRSAELFDVARRLLREAGWSHYEVSSYARPGREAVHNRAYWHGHPYLGVGAAAHGLLEQRRWVNHRRPNRYIEACLGGSPEAESERISDELWAWERVMTGLRDLERGVERRWLQAATGSRYEALEARGCLESVGSRLRIHEERVLVLDSLLLELAP